MCGEWLSVIEGGREGRREGRRDGEGWREIEGEGGSGGEMHGGTEGSGEEEDCVVSCCQL